MLSSPFTRLSYLIKNSFSETGIKFKITSTTALMIGIANNKMKIFPANSILEATEASQHL